MWNGVSEFLELITSYSNCCIDPCTLHCTKVCALCRGEDSR
uniref:Uncharacterized protein n=1 Tax=Anguilla anguilla TaxID=7936 RepID=A0A0E9T5Z6_ANGAN